ncbi:hypothetical protein Sango_2554400 [Sesamum angolense]|uniref:Uncharacterized protein n=1 Tax=Sesamum angolense TaxID=2727404 RepID=A0AAE2BIN4_9LAMI|nr:hypothetical protein Sango_2554400 [Sesamum angolense]
MLRRCKTLSRQLGRTLSYSSLRSKSVRDHYYQESWGVDGDEQRCEETYQTIFVGSLKRRYVISSRYLDHPLVNALIEKSREKTGQDGDPVFM